MTLALVYWSLTPWLGIPLGMLVGAVAAFLIGTPTFRLRGHYFALSMLAYPLAIMYIMEYLGFQEVSLPMHREHPFFYLQFTDPRLYTVLALAFLVVGAAGLASPRRTRASAWRCWRSGRTSWPPRPPASTPAPGRCAR